MKNHVFLLFALFVTLQTIAQNIVPEILVHKEQIKITCLNILNTKQREVNLNITPDGALLFFMSSRGGNKWNTKYSGYENYSFDGDIYVSERFSGNWTTPLVMLPPVSTGRGEDEPMISPDAQRVSFQSWREDWQTTGGPYYCAEMHGPLWANPVGLGGGITEFFAKERPKTQELATDGACMSPDGNRFIFTYGRSYDGDMDIYYSDKDATGKWGSVKRLPVSTPKNERSIFLAADGQTLYFASDGYGGFGGLDILKTTIYKDGSNGVIINVGKPFNTEKNDFGLILNANGKEAWFVRNDDIYYADLSNANPKIRPKNTTLVTGIITNSQKIPVESTISLLQKNGTLITTGKSDFQTGKFLILTNETTGKFDIEIKSKDYKTFKKEIDLQQKNKDGYTEINVEIPESYTLQQKKIPLEKERFLAFSVYFDFNKDNLTQTALDTLAKNFSKFKINQIKRIDLTGHTDSIGTNLYNMGLGKRRALQVANYFEQKGFPKTNINTMISYGENKPKDTNKSDTGRQNNRRVEIKIILRE